SASASPRCHLLAPSAAPFHSGRSGSRRDTNVGSPPIVSVNPAAASAASAASPPASTADHTSSVYGVVGRGSDPIRAIDVPNATQSAAPSAVPATGAARAGGAGDAG